MNVGALLALLALPVSAQQAPPNIVLVMADDLGREWLSCYGSQSIETPHLDALAKSGTRFHGVYSMPICTPTRTTLLTGQYPWRHGWSDHWDVPRWGGGCHFDPERNVTFARALRARGYATAIAGKWQINDFRAQPDVLDAHGFDEWCVWTGFETGVAASAERYWGPYLHTRDGSTTREGRFGADVLLEFTVDFLRRNRDGPALVYLPLCLPHGPLVATPLEPDAAGAERYPAMVRYVDHVVGELVAALDELGLREETVVLFTTDNGSPRGQTGRLDGADVRGGKGRLSEAGTRVPLIASGPGVAAAAVSDALCDFTDLFPTLLDLAGAAPPEGHALDGHSLAPVLRGEATATARTTALTMGGRFAWRSAEGVRPRLVWADRAVTDGHHKLWYQDGAPAHLFDLDADPFEEHDLIDAPDPVSAAALARLRAAAEAAPARDAWPRYDPTPPQVWDKPVEARPAAARQAAPEARAPNVVLLMADDQGYGDAGFRGHPRLETPHLDAMAANGLSLERFYAAAPVCSPTRASALTGRHPMRLGIPGANAGHLEEAEVTLAEVLRGRGYRTGFFGKWHLGTLTLTEKDSNRGGRPAGEKHYSPPTRHGFDVAFATEAKVPTHDPMVHPSTGEPYGTAYWDGDGARVTANVAGDDSRVIVDRVEPFVRAAVEADEPFFAVVWFHAPHLPVVAGADRLAQYADVKDQETRAYYGCISALDEQVGRVRALLRELGVADETLLWYASDNGPEGKAGAAPGTAGPLRGRKRDVWEGGVRVPGIIEWPAGVAAGRVSDVPCVTSDILPTIATLVGAEAPQALDGVDLGPLLAGEMDTRGAPIAFWSRTKLALTGDRWKAVSTDGGERWQLYDLLADPGEAADLAAERPGRAAQMASAFEAWREEVQADAAEPGPESLRAEDDPPDRPGG